MFIILRGSAFMLATENREMVMTRLSCNFMDFLYLLKVCSKLHVHFDIHCVLLAYFNTVNISMRQCLSLVHQCLCNT